MRYNNTRQHDKHIQRELQKAICEHLTAYMDVNGLNQKELAAELNIPPSAVNKALYGQHNNFTIKRLIDIGLKTGKKPVLSFVDMQANSITTLK